jgi:hypothetical protein
VIEARGMAIGTEERTRRTTRGSTVERRERNYRFLLDGIAVSMSATTTVTLGEEGHVDQTWWSAGDLVRTWEGHAVLFDHLPPVRAPLTVDLVEPALATTGSVVVHPTADGNRREDGLGWTRWEGAELVAFGAGSIRAERREGGPAPGVDLQGLFRVPSEPLPKARSARLLHARLDGEELRVEVPLRLEIPSQRRALLDRLVAVVQYQLDVRPHPEPSASLAMLAAGDCTEHAGRLAELAVQAELSATVVTGLVYDDRSAGPGFYPHAWALVDGIPVDPVLGQVPTDATHIPRGEGDDLTWLARLGTEPIQLIELR